ncbi:MAG: hypothetical protein F7B59_03430 [Desulfurococcales archaeon]|nr:hypothetical protein [Desulfurococcales archaeon]
MAKSRDKKSKPRKKKSKGSHEMGSISIKILDFIVGYRKILTILTLTAITILAFYVRYLPATRYGLELDANDPWIEYWLAEYLHQHGLFAFKGLEHVTEFWWPYGRNFMSTEYIGVPWFAAATYPIAAFLGLSLKGWVALTPVLAGTLAVIIGFYLVYRITNSMLGGLVSSMLFAMLPGAITRTIVGFVEKTGIAVPNLLIFLLFTYMMFESKDKKKSLLYGVLAGFFGGTIGWIWGGIHFVTALFALIVIIAPLVRTQLEKWKKYSLLANYVTYAIIASLYPKVGLFYFVKGVGAAVTLSIILFYMAYWLYSKGYSIEHYLVIILAVILVGGVAVFSGYLPVGGRILAALGVNKLSPLLTSVQENQGASIHYIVNEYGIALILAVIGVFYELYLILTRKNQDPVTVAIYLAVILLLYGNMNLSYLTQMSATISSIAAGIFVGDVVEFAFTSEGGSLGKLSLKKSSSSLDPLPIIIAGTLVIIVVSGALLQFSDSLTMAKFHAPQIETSGLSPFKINNTIIVPINNAWKEALQYINESTPKDALIVAWWDYGYWITVNTGRRTVADGATLNGTQIRLLARILTGTDGEASALLRMLGAKPNETYILAYEVFYFFKNNDTLIVMPAYNMPSSNIEEAIYRQKGYYVISQGQADWAKSFQMLRIGRRVNPDPRLTPFDTNYSSVYYAWKNFPGLVGVPTSVVNKVRNTLIYQLMIDGAYNIIGHRVGCNDPLFSNVTKVEFIVRAMGSGLGGQGFVPIPKPTNIMGFVPEKVFIGCPYVTPDHTQATGVMIILYKWTG